MVSKLAGVLLSLVTLTAVGCQGTGGNEKFASAQQALQSVAANYPSLVRLTLHAMPQGEAQMKAIASTSADKCGKPSDPEDIAAVKDGKESVLEEGDNLDVTLPIADTNGHRIAAAGVTLKSNGRTRDQLIADARTIAGQLGSAVRAAGKPLW
ncbi:MAG: hypothetical protein R3F56_13765 [Planctomycetota bacterium]